ncbi:MAG TPA: GntR family transcriptional regulator [Thermoleophilaceae bacterium]|nr:GntR family transcriptional regulator [Thermoleophilaceae bacterium]
MPGKLDLSIDRGTGIPLGAQLAGRIRAAVQDGTLAPGERVPSVREFAEIAGVNVNTARAVYARLESEGLVRSEQGRGTFIAAGTAAGGAATRQQLHRQIAELEAALVRLPPPPLGPEDSQAVTPPGRAALLSTEDLEAVRDRLVVRLHQLDAQRATVLQRLEELGAEDETTEVTEATPRRATPSLAGARIRWVGA